MSNYKVWKKEFFQLGRLALFSVLTNVFEYGFIIVDMIMLGRLGKGNLASGAIGMLVYNIAWYFIEGFLTAQDTLVARGVIVRDLAAARYWSYVSLMTTSSLAVFCSSIFAFSPLLIPYGFYVNEHVASKAIAHAFLLLPAFWFQIVFRVFQKYQQSQKIMLPSLVCSFIGLIANILGNYLFMYTFGIGFWGCGIATSLSRFLMLVVLCRYVLSKEDLTIVADELKLLRVELRYPDVQPTTTGVDHNRTWNAVDNRILGSDQPLDEMPLTAEEGKQSSDTTTVRGVYSGVVREEEEGEGVELTSHHNSSSRGSSGNSSSQTIHRTKKNERRKSNNSTSGSGGRAKGNYKELAEEEEEGEEEEGEGGGEPGENSNNNNNNEDDDGDEEGQQQSSLLRPVSEVEGHRNKLYANIWKFCLIGMPGALMLSIDCWSYEVCALFAAQLGNISLDSYIILVLTINFFYLVFPFSISVAASVRINKLLEHNRHSAAAIVARLSLLLGFALMLLSSAGVYFFVEYVGYIFTTDQDIVLRLRGLVTVYAVLFQVFYGLQGSLLGPLRCTSHHWEILGFGFVSMWPVALGLGYYLAFETYPKQGLEGLWLGLMVGMGLQCCGLLFLFSTVDWEKEAKRMAIRNGRAVRISERLGSVAASGGAGTSTGATGSSDSATLSLIHPHEVGAPVIGSRAIGGFPTTFVSNEEELDEFEIVELGRDPNAMDDEDNSDTELGLEEEGQGLGGGSGRVRRHLARGQIMERGVEMTRLDER